MTTPTPVLDVPIEDALQRIAEFAADHYMLGNPLALDGVRMREVLKNLTEAAYGVASTQGGDFTTPGSKLAADDGTLPLPDALLRDSLRTLTYYIGWSDYRIEFGTQTITPNGSMTPDYTTYDGTVTDAAGGGVSLSNSTLTDGVYGRPVDLNYLPLAAGNWRLFSLVDNPVLAIHSSDVIIITESLTATAQEFTVGTPVDGNAVPGIGFYVDSSASPTITGSMRLQYLGVGGTWDVPTA